MAPNPPSPHAAQEKSQLKIQGQAFGQAFQTVFKVSAMYSVDHPAAGRSMQQAWELLVPLLKQGGQFRFGFMNERLLLNSSLVSHANLTHLEVEFTKREVATITFQAGVTLKDFKRALALLTTRPMVIAERGGIKKFLAGNLIDGVRITPAGKPKEESDTVDVGMDIESYLTAQAILDPEGGSGSRALDLLLGAAGGQKAQEVDRSPQELMAVAEEATRKTMADPDGDLSELLAAVTQMLSGMKPDSLLASLPPEKQAEFRGHPPRAMAENLMEDAVAGWVAGRLAPGTGSEGGGGAGGAATGGGGTGGAGTGNGGAGGAGTGSGGTGNIDEGVLQALMRGLKATRVAERLMQKLALFIEQANLPKEVYDRLNSEVMWFTLTAEKKHAHLISQERYTPADFARLVNYVQEAVLQGRISEATEMALHFFSTWEKAPSSVRAEELKRAPELLRVLASVQTVPLMHTLAEPLLREILDETHLHWPCHVESTNCLAIVAQNAGRFEDFEFVHKIASDLKRLMARRPGQHADCCGKALAGLLAPEALERLIESFLQRRNDMAWVRTTTSLLTMIGPLSAELAQHRLAEEPAASNRMALIRLIRNLGACAIEATRKRLSDQRWYVVRNAAYILGDLGDPELPKQLRGALRHTDSRVQLAAITAILKSNAAGRGEILAEALTQLQAGVVEMALDELTILKDPASVEYLEALVLTKGELKTSVLEKAVIALGAVPSDRAAGALYGIIIDAAQPLLVRRTALGGLYNHGSAMAPGLVEKLASLPPGDPLAGEVRKAA
ncbi:MAG: HEAT repeat domain-containing protein [Terriglobia bacterium]